jgi:hypothetical protein
METEGEMIAVHGGKMSLLKARLYLYGLKLGIAGPDLDKQEMTIYKAEEQKKKNVRKIIMDMEGSLNYEEKVTLKKLSERQWRINDLENQIYFELKDKKGK